jgi:hypothetical protein
MSDKTVFEKITEEIVTRLLGEKGNTTPLAKQLINKQLEKIIDKGKEWIKSGGDIEDVMEELLKDYKETVTDKAVEDFKNMSEVRDLWYTESYNKLKALGDEGKSWGGLFEEVYADAPFLCEIFVRLVEEQEGVKITSAKQLQELTGITEVYLELLNPELKQSSKQQAKKEALKQITETFIEGMAYRYEASIKTAIKTGAKYKDLLKIDPKEFNLPETWGSFYSRPANKENTILSCIADDFLLQESIVIHPDLRDIAEELEAPYSVIIEAKNMVNFRY